MDKNLLLKSSYYYDLPEELIAQTPVEPRDSQWYYKRFYVQLYF